MPARNARSGRRRSGRQRRRPPVPCANTSPADDDDANRRGRCYPRPVAVVGARGRSLTLIAGTAMAFRTLGIAVGAGEWAKGPLGSDARAGPRLPPRSRCSRSVASRSRSRRAAITRAHGPYEDNCRFVCGEDPDGMPVETLDVEPFLTVNGTRTLSHAAMNPSGMSLCRRRRGACAQALAAALRQGAGGLGLPGRAGRAVRAGAGRRSAGAARPLARRTEAGAAARGSVHACGTRSGQGGNRSGGRASAIAPPLPSPHAPWHPARP